MSATTLYELADARDILEQWLEESEGELTPELATLLNELEGKTTEKIERVALFIREQLATAKAIGEEAERLTQRRKVREKAAESLKQYLHVQMERLGKTKVEGVLATVALQRNPPSVQPLIDLGLAPVAFIRVIPEQKEWDKKAMLAAWKENSAALSGVAVVTQSQSIRIR